MNNLGLASKIGSPRGQRPGLAIGPRPRPLPRDCLGLQGLRLGSPPPFPERPGLLQHANQVDGQPRSVAPFGAPDVGGGSAPVAALPPALGVPGGFGRRNSSRASPPLYGAPGGSHPPPRPG